MKIKIRKDKNTKETIIEYFRIVKKTEFRYNLLQKIIADIDKDSIIIVDTNLRIGQEPIEGIVKFLEQSCLRYSETQIKKDNNRLFGIKMDGFSKNKNKTPERLFVLEISSAQFTQELFQACFKNYDVALGIGNKKTFKEICDSTKLGFDGELFFNEEYFEESVYDSITCAMLRSSYDIEKYALEVKKQ